MAQNQQYVPVGLPRSQAIMNNGLRIDVGSTASAIDLSNNATGENDILVPDNVADAFNILQSTNSFLKVVTTNNAEYLEFGRLLKFAVSTIDMNDTTHTLVYGTAGANQTQLVAPILYVDPNSAGGTENLVLPAEATSTGKLLIIANTAGGGEDIVVQDDTPATVITISQNEIGIVFCDGTTWRGGVMAIT
jgi:hypothetical protein